jgi:hypothetical protein
LLHNATWWIVSPFNGNGSDDVFGKSQIGWSNKSWWKTIGGNKKHLLFENIYLQIIYNRKIF